MRYKDFHYSMRNIRRFNREESAVEQPSYSLRELVDNMLTGKPVNSNLRHHKPLPPDGENEDDYDSGTREVIDLADLQVLNEEVEAARQVLEKEANLRASKQKDEDFKNAVEAEIQRRAAAQ